MKINLSTSVEQLGFGIFGLNLLVELEKLGHEVSLWTGSVETQAMHANVVQKAIERKVTYDRLAPSVSISGDFARHIGKGLHAAVLVFEGDRFEPGQVYLYQQQDVLFVLTEWAKAVVRQYQELAKIPVHVIRHGVDRSLFNEQRTSNPVPDGATRFLGIGKWELRKGHDFLIKAFNAAFSEHDNVELWMASTNPFLTVEQNNVWRDSFKNSRLGSKVKLLHKRAPAQDGLLPLIAQADCGVFPARAEGWNLPLLEMMSCGKSVIATNYSGHTEFCDPNNCLLIDVDKVEPAQDSVPFKAQGYWGRLGQRQLDQMVEHFRNVHRLKQAGALQTNMAGVATAKELTWRSVAERLVKGLVE